MKKFYCFFLLLFTAQFIYGQCTPVDNIVYTSDCTYDNVGVAVNIGSGSDVTISDSGDPADPTDVIWNVGSYTIQGWTIILTTNFGNLTVDEGATLTINGDLIMSEFGILTVNGTLHVIGDVTHTIGASLGDRFNIGPNGTINIDGDLDLSGPFGFTGVLGTWEGALNVTGTVVGTGNLPVELTYLKASPEEENITIEWETATEENASHFDIERSTDLENWQAIGSVQAAGNSQTSIYYQFEDKSPLPKAYYRLKQVDFDGEYAYYGPLIINHQGISETMNATIMPNNISTGEKVHFNMSGLNVGNDVFIQVYNNQGHTVHFEEVNDISTNNLFKPMDFTSHLRSGMYYVVIKSGKSVVKEKLLIN
ncbi:T9SS type A sorting domain-containing protein [Flammeovirga aprica]|uniref:T9SS type A sorting domain-containing protein n=1 Tax=Flammeovirga aprica JL-4 TaxID=694437 RepID=A0A7X9P043_9BACT|nr:T9SS type A sorting domain-containing protein [Flammeovirga aprica]NME66970.1 T9SS type A sorting domain-containing protein [Flammeovirga aprica JL-4]